MRLSRSFDEGYWLLLNAVDAKGRYFELKTPQT